MNQFRSHLKSGKRNKSYIVSGQSNRLGFEFATGFAMSINCENMDDDFCGTCKSCRMISGKTHPDFQIYDVEKNKTKIGIETIKLIQQDSSKTNYTAKSRFNIILNADKTTVPAQNALLKTLEDGASNCTTILLTDSPDLILPTIHSRSIFINLPPLPEDMLTSKLVELGLSKEDAQNEYNDSGGDLDWLFWFLKNKDYGENILRIISKNEDLSEMIEIILDPEYTEGLRLIYPQILSKAIKANSGFMTKSKILAGATKSLSMYKKEKLDDLCIQLSKVEKLWNTQIKKTTLLQKIMTPLMT